MSGWAQRDAEEQEEAAGQLAALRAEVERLRVGHDRYETVRRMNVPQFRDAFVLSNRTGKPFDEIVDDMRPFLMPNVADERRL